MSLESNKINLQSILSSVNMLPGISLQEVTITPSISSQTILPSAGYDAFSKATLLSVTSTIDSNIQPSNIKSGVSILGVTGTYQAGGMTPDEERMLNEKIAGTISYASGNVSSLRSYAFQCCSSLITASFPNCNCIGRYAFQSCYSLITASFPNCSYISSYAFYVCYSLATISFPNCVYMENYAFQYCYSLTTASFPNCSYIGSSAFQYCSSLTTISFPICSRIGSDAFQNCSSLTTVSFPNCRYIGMTAFSRCFKLISLYLMYSSVCSLPYSNAFSSTPIGGYSTVAGQYGSIYVPASLLTSYKAATNWIYFSSRFVGV